MMGNPPLPHIFPDIYSQIADPWTAAIGTVCELKCLHCDTTQRLTVTSPGIMRVEPGILLSCVGRAGDHGIHG